MLYTKYRPTRFDQCLGSKIISLAIKKSITNKQHGHAYFFYGPRGVGKTTIARIIAAALNCSHAKNGEPCGSCDICRKILSGRFLDVVEVDGASTRGIDDIRSIRDSVGLAPSRGKVKIYIIDEVHMLTKEAFNALLKTLEEPPEHVVFILCTTEEKKVPQTIKSRCQQFELKRASMADLVSKLNYILEKERASGIKLPKVSEDDLKKIARASAGGFRDAETMLEQVIYGGLSVDDLLSFTSEDELASFVDTVLIRKDLAESIKELGRAANSGMDLSSWVGNLLDFLRGIMVVGAGAAEVLEESESNVALMEEISAKADIDDISYFIEKFLDAKEKMKYASLESLPLEVALVDVIFKGKEKEEKKGASSAGPQGPRPKGSAIGNAEREDRERVSKKAPGSSSRGKFSMELLYEAVRPHNHSVEALLKSCKVKEINDKSLVLEAFYSFHRERLTTVSARRVLDMAAESIFGKPVKVSVVLGKKIEPKEDLTDKNIIIEKGPKAEAVKDAWEVFDGSVS